MFLWPAGKLLYLELLVKVININYDQQPEILTRSETLHDYSLFIDIVRQEQALGKSRDEAIKAAIEICIARGILADYLKMHGSEVYNMLLTEWNIDDAQKV